MQSVALGAKTAQRLMSSNRDAHLYSSFFTVLFSMPFGCLSILSFKIAKNSFNLYFSH